MLAIRPSEHSLMTFLGSRRAMPFTYHEVGCTRRMPSSGFDVDATREQIGMGEQEFAAAQNALRRWRQFQLGWLRAWPCDTPLVAGREVGVAASFVGLTWLNACRIVYVVDEDGPTRRFGFAYGTLPGHAECGEERFLVEWDRATDEVWYDILAFSRPGHWLSRLGYPLVRRLQKRFARESVAAMRAAVAAERVVRTHA